MGCEAGSWIFNIFMSKMYLQSWLTGFVNKVFDAETELTLLAYITSSMENFVV